MEEMASTASAAVALAFSAFRVADPGMDALAELLTDGLHSSHTMPFDVLIRLDYMPGSLVQSVSLGWYPNTEEWIPPPDDCRTHVIIGPRSPVPVRINPAAVDALVFEGDSHLVSAATAIIPFFLRINGLPLTWEAFDGATNRNNAEELCVCVVTERADEHTVSIRFVIKWEECGHGPESILDQRLRTITALAPEGPVVQAPVWLPAPPDDDDESSSGGSSPTDLPDR
jgi:hypothetical protein